MAQKIARNEIKREINNFFEGIKTKTKKEVSKMKKLAMGSNISLKEQRKKFCKHCLTPYSGSEKIRIKKGLKSVTCKKCNKIARWKIKLS